MDDQEQKFDGAESGETVAAMGDDAFAQEATQALETTDVPHENTAETRQNQAKDGAKVANAAPNLDDHLARFISNVGGLLAEKEKLQLLYIEKRVPRAYYVRWKHEANALTSLVVGLHRRRAAIRAKTGG